MKKTLSLISFFVIAFAGKGQQVASFSELGTFKSNYFFTAFIGETQNMKFYSSWHNPSDSRETRIMLSRYNPDNKELKSGECKSDKIGQNKTYMVSIMMIEGKICLFKYTAEKSTCTLYVQEIDPQTLSLDGTVKEVTSRSFKHDHEIIDRAFVIGLNADSSKVVILANNFGEAEGEKAKLFFHVLSTDFNSIWKKEIQMDQRIDELQDLSFFFAANGDLYGT